MHPAKDLGHASQMASTSSSFASEIRPTWTSAARAVLGHGRRQATQRSKHAQSLEDLERADLSELPPAGRSTAEQAAFLATKEVLLSRSHASVQVNGTTVGGL